VSFGGSLQRAGAPSHWGNGKTVLAKRFLFLNRFGTNLEHKWAGPKRVEPEFFAKSKLFPELRKKLLFAKKISNILFSKMVGAIFTKFSGFVGDWVTAQK